MFSHVDAGLAVAAGIDATIAAGKPVSSYNVYSAASTGQA